MDGSRRSDQPVDLSVKRQKIDTEDKAEAGASASNTDRVPVMTITDINDRCLAHIFQFLGLGDLLNIVDSSKRFTNAANLVFTRKYKNRWNLQPSQERNGNATAIQGKNINDLRTALKFLRCFGHALTTLDVNITDSSSKHCDVVLNYVNTFCASNLTEIEITGNSFILQSSHFKKPFPKVEKVTLNSCQPAESTDLKKWFPKMTDFYHFGNKAPLWEKERYAVDELFQNK